MLESVQGGSAETAWGLFQQGEQGMWVLCLHDSAVRFSGCARNDLTGITYGKLNVNIQTSHRDPGGVFVFHLP